MRPLASTIAVVLVFPLIVDAQAINNQPTPVADFPGQTCDTTFDGPAEGAFGHAEHWTSGIPNRQALACFPDQAGFEVDVVGEVHATVAARNDQR